MPLLRDAWTLGRFLAGLPAFLGKRMNYAEAAAVIRARAAAREAHFLTLVRAVLEDERSPYRALMRLARASYADVEQQVGRDGIEAALFALRSSGVYVNFEEFKGRAPLVRHGQEVPLDADAFDNPRHTRFFQVSTGGSTGRGSGVAVDLEHLWDSIPGRLINDRIHGFVGVPIALWFDGLPGNGPHSLITRVAYDSIPERWFSPVQGAGSRPALKFRLAQAGMLTVANLTGTRLPWPESVTLDQADVVARWAADALRRHGKCGVKTLVSRALRVCLAAERAGIDLTGMVISGGGEPPTPAKVAAVRRTGARWVSNYNMQEVGAVGYCCGNAVDENDQHLLMDQLALVTHPRLVPGFDLTVDSFHVTTLLPTARKVMLNVELDDYGIMEERSCGCAWEEFGFRTHLREIRSFRKLTGEGMTLIGTDMIRILEEDLPRAFGGSPLDYQLMEEEDERGFTRLSLVVSPDVNLPDEEAAIRLVMEAVGKSGHAGALSRAIWSQAGSMRVTRTRPTWTGRGKLMPLHLARSSRRVS